MYGADSRRAAATRWCHTRRSLGVMESVGGPAAKTAVLKQQTKALSCAAFRSAILVRHLLRMRHTSPGTGMESSSFCMRSRAPLVFFHRSANSISVRFTTPMCS